jgi:hypothetical protein
VSFTFARRRAVAAAITALAAASAASSAMASAGFGSPNPAHYTSTVVGGASPLPTDKTIPHWHGSFTDPTNGVTYGYNMVGSADPRTPGLGSLTVPTDVIPVNFVFAANRGLALDAGTAITGLLNSPIFQPFRYSSTAQVSDSTLLGAQPGGVLSAGNAGVQYEDAIMRAQFGVTSTNFHLDLGTPTVFPQVTIAVPQNQGSVSPGPLGVQGGVVSYPWFVAQIQNLVASLHLEPTHLPIFFSNNIFLFDASQGYILGFHGAATSANGNGNKGVQTYAYATWLPPGGSPAYFAQDIHLVSHEISEWADDPFINNTVNPWLDPRFGFGCSKYLETGDPVEGVGFTLPGNTYLQNGVDIPGGTIIPGDGYWHPEDEAFLPWFARQSPNTTSQKVQNGTTGRYTFMGNLDPFAGTQVPATGC